MNFCAKRSLGAVGRFAELLDDPRVAFRVGEHDNYWPPDYRTAAEAEAAVARLRERAHASSCARRRATRPTTGRGPSSACLEDMRRASPADERPHANAPA